MKVLRKLDSSGDTVIEFDETAATEAARKEAEALFERARQQGGAAFKVHRANGLPDERATDFGTLENETILVPRIVGG
jgi:hypothetical protein